MWDINLDDVYNWLSRLLGAGVYRSPLTSHSLCTTILYSLQIVRLTLCEMIISTFNSCSFVSFHHIISRFAGLPCLICIFNRHVLGVL